MEDKKEDTNKPSLLSSDNKNCQEFSYDSLWEKEEAKKEKKLINELPKGIPRKGIKGKWIKKKAHVGRIQLKNSWKSYYKTSEGKIE